MLIGRLELVEPNLVAGWAADTEAPNSIVDVIIYMKGARVAQVSCDQLRQDLEARTDLGGNGRHGFRYNFDPPLSCKSASWVSVRIARNGATLPGERKENTRHATFSPILVTAPGRSGTTLLMNRLSQSPDICVARIPPFEVRLITYWTTVFRTLAAAPNFEKSTHPDQLAGDGFRFGSNPFSGISLPAFRLAELGSNISPNLFQMLQPI